MWLVGIRSSPEGKTGQASGRNTGIILDRPGNTCPQQHSFPLYKTDEHWCGRVKWRPVSYIIDYTRPTITWCNMPCCKTKQINISPGFSLHLSTANLKSRILLDRNCFNSRAYSHLCQHAASIFDKALSYRLHGLNDNWARGLIISTSSKSWHRFGKYRSFSVVVILSKANILINSSLI